MVGEVVTALEMNTEVRDFAAGLQAAWTSFASVWTGTVTNPALGNGTQVCRYNLVGKTLDVALNLTAGSTTTFGSGGYLFSLPGTTNAAGINYVGTAWMNGGARWGGNTLAGPGSALMAPYFPTSATNVQLTQMTSASPEAFNSGDSLRMFLRCELA